MAGRRHRQPVPANGAPIVPGFPIRYVGVLWDEDDDDHLDHPGAAVRFRINGRWTKWQDLRQDHFRRSGLFASLLVPAHGADAYQLRALPAWGRNARTVAFNLHDH